MTRSITLVGLVTALALAAPSAHAVCLDPTTSVSGYHVPLDEELKTSTAVVVGRVTKRQDEQDDRSDPTGITGFVYTVQVARQLKGHVPQLIRLHAENDSGGYRMEVGEEHLLFLRSEGPYFVADICGNSAQLPQGNDVIARVESALSSKRNK